MGVPTPHLEAKLGDIAKTVLMPGDPLRAQVVADTFLTDVVKYNNVRGMNGFTGMYNGKRVSVQGSGMGMPSIGIYSYELYNFYGVENIIRIGSAGAIVDDLDLGDLIIGMSASTNSSYAKMFELPGTFAPTASWELLEKAVAAAKEQGVRYKVGNVLSSDVFYGEPADFMQKWRKMGVLAVEMESAALYMNAAAAGKNALCLLTVSDCIFKGGAMSTDDRQNSFTQMMKVALSLA